MLIGDPCLRGTQTSRWGVENSTNILEGVKKADIQLMHRAPNKCSPFPKNTSHHGVLLSYTFLTLVSAWLMKASSLTLLTVSHNVHNFSPRPPNPDITIYLCQDYWRSIIDVQVPAYQNKYVFYILSLESVTAKISNPCPTSSFKYSCTIKVTQLTWPLWH